MRRTRSPRGYRRRRLRTYPPPPGALPGAHVPDEERRRAIPVDTGLHDGRGPPRRRLRRNGAAGRAGTVKASWRPASRCTRRRAITKVALGRHPSRPCRRPLTAFRPVLVFIPAPAGARWDGRRDRSSTSAVSLAARRERPAGSAPPAARPALARNEEGELDRLLGHDGGLRVVAARRAGSSSTRRDRARPQHRHRSVTARGRLSIASRHAS